MPSSSDPISRRTMLASAAAFLAACRSALPDARGVSTEGRAVDFVLDAQPTVEGAGVHLARTIGGRQLDSLDPFLLLDDIHSSNPEDYEKGFPRHPHRGFETVTYMITGAMEHRDNNGNHGRLVGGSAQWMTAGHGILHSEMPKQDQGELFGLQLWVNLPRDRKLMAPRYQDIPPDRIPEVSVQGARVRVVAGKVQNQSGPVDGIIVAPTMIDIALPAGASFDQELPVDHAAFAYVLDGSGVVGSARTQLVRRELCGLGKGPLVHLEGGKEGGRFLLVAAMPLNEPIARRGPFVMNTEAELDQAWADYKSGALTRL